MTMQQQLKEIMKLPQEEQIELIGKVWDGIAAKGKGNFTISADERNLLRQRSNALNEGTPTFTLKEIRNNINSCK